VEATKKTSTTKAALLVIAALSMLLSGLFIATASRSDASPPPACPDGFSLTADAKNCFRAATVTSADNANSCPSGELTPDATKCYVAARVIPQEGATVCPKGYSPDNSLNNMCARFEPATQGKAICPGGAAGTAGGCYILVAKGPRGAATCTNGVLVGTNCVITGDKPVNGPSSCPESDKIIKTGTECYTLVAKTSIALVCDAADVANYNADPYTLLDGICKFIPATAGMVVPAGGFTCPAAVSGIGTATHTATPVDNHMKIGVCTLTGVGTGPCPVSTTVDSNGVDCRRPVDLKPGAKVCKTGFGIVGTSCIRYEVPTASAPQCPIGSVEDSVGACRKPVADQKGAYYCKDANAALNGKSCVWTTGFLINPSDTLYKCDAGARTVIGSGSATQVICILGDADPNTSSEPTCPQGVPSTDRAYCIVPRIDTAPAAAVAAPVPSFTG